MGDIWTCEVWSSGECREIDSLTDMSLHAELVNTNVVMDIVCRSDHRAAWANFGNMKTRKKRYGSHRKSEEAGYSLVARRWTT
eukprot:6236716-Pyramimonas_sp.AAC.1